MNRIYYLIILALILPGLGCEGVFNSDDQCTESFSAEDVEEVAMESSEADSITADVTLHVGAQILEMNFRKFRDKAYDKDGNFFLQRNNEFADNLERLYNDVDRVIE